MFTPSTYTEHIKQFGYRTKETQWAYSWLFASANLAFRLVFTE
jgi:hypothetical protein